MRPCEGRQCHERRDEPQRARSYSGHGRSRDRNAATILRPSRLPRGRAYFTPRCTRPGRSRLRNPHERNDRAGDGRQVHDAIVSCSACARFFAPLLLLASGHDPARAAAMRRRCAEASLPHGRGLDGAAAATVEGPLAADARPSLVATRDGAVRSLEAASGPRPLDGGGAARVSSAVGDGLLVVRHQDGTVWGMDPATGYDRWKAASGVGGSLPPVIYKDAVVVAGERPGRPGSGHRPDALEAAEARATAPPVAWGPWILVGEADGALRCRDLGHRRRLWSYPDRTGPGRARPSSTPTDACCSAPPTAASSPSTCDKKGDERWRWKVGADVQTPPAVSGPHVLFTTHEDVLYALRRGNGHLAWRAALPSRPLAGPLLLRRRRSSWPATAAGPARPSSSASTPRTGQPAGRPQGAGRDAHAARSRGRPRRHGPARAGRGRAASRRSLAPESLTTRSAIAQHSFREPLHFHAAPSGAAHNPSSRGVM